MSKTRRWLIGRWELPDEYSRIVFEIGDTGKRLRVRAYDKVDGEEFAVSKVRWDGRYLSFDIRVPSSGWRTSNRVRPLSQTKLLQELTYWELWKKVLSGRKRKTPS